MGMGIVPSLDQAGDRVAAVAAGVDVELEGLGPGDATLHVLVHPTLKLAPLVRSTVATALVLKPAAAGQRGGVAEGLLSAAETKLAASAVIVLLKVTEPLPSQCRRVPHDRPGR